jgi:hypothetical protein
MTANVLTTASAAPGTEGVAPVGTLRATPLLVLRSRLTPGPSEEPEGPWAPAAPGPSGPHEAERDVDSGARYVRPGGVR